MRVTKCLIAILILISMVLKCRAEYEGCITEIAFDESAGADWLEIYITDGGDMEGAKLFHSYYNKASTCIKVFPEITTEDGDYIILHINDQDSTPDETDDTGDTDGNGYWDIYTDFKRGDHGVFSTDSILWITETDTTTWMDFLAYSQRAEKSYYGSDGQDVYNAAVARSEWNPESENTWEIADYEKNCADTSSGLDSGESLKREATATGAPQDTNTKDDWKVGATSQGEDYSEVQPIIGRIKIENSPFFPRGDNAGQAVAGKITYKLDGTNYYITLAIYDVNGYAKKYLLRSSPSASGQGTLSWDGYDESGELVPSGIYIVSLTAENKTSGSLKKAQGTIIVGRKLD